MIGPVVDPARALECDAAFRRAASAARSLVIRSHAPGMIPDGERRRQVDALLMADHPLAIATATLPFLGDEDLTDAAQDAVQFAHELACDRINEARGHA